MTILVDSCLYTKKLSFIILVALTILVFTGVAIFVSYFINQKTYAKQIVNDKPLVLKGNEVLEIVNTHFVQKNKVTLEDNASLIIRDSLFEHLEKYSFQYALEATDNAQVIIQNSEIKSSPWLNWNFNGGAFLSIDNVEQENSNIWHSFAENAKAKIKNSKFSGTMANSVNFDIENSPKTFIEFVYPVGAVVDEELPSQITDYSFPNSNDQNIGMNLKIKNSGASSWGITVNPNSSVTIRNTDSLVATLVIGSPWNNVTANFDNLRVTRYQDQTWHVVDTSLRLVNVKTERWSPIVGGNNTLIITNSDLADNAFSWGDAKVVIENSTASFLRAQDSVQMTIKNSIIYGDVIAVGNGKIILINTEVKGKIVEEDNGKVLIL